jgi:glycosyltransferase involved in cell wall biosynthesis
MAAQPSVSVVITTLNRTGLLRQAVASVLAQDFSDFEIVVSDDAGTNDVPAVLREFDDLRIRYRRNERRLGLAGNTLAASLEARGKYVSYLNDDDLWEPDLLATMVPPLEADDDLVLAFSDHHVADLNGVVDAEATDVSTRGRGRDGLPPGIHRSFARIGLVDRAIHMALATVMRRQAIDWDDFPLAVGCYTDCWIVYLAWRTGMSAHYEPRRLARYRRHTAAMTRVDTSPCALAGDFCYARFLQDPGLRHLKRELARRRARILAIAAIGLMQAGRVAEAQKLARRAIRAQLSPSTAAVSLMSLLPGAAAGAAAKASVGARKLRSGGREPLG